MEKLTIAKITADKEIQTKFGAKMKQGVQFKEYGEIWHDLWGGGRKVGEIVEGTRASREYEGKTYWSFNFPKKTDEINDKLEKIFNKLTQMNLLLSSIQQHVVIGKKNPPEEIDYPENTLDEAFPDEA